MTAEQLQAEFEEIKKKNPRKMDEAYLAQLRLEVINIKEDFENFYHVQYKLHGFDASGPYENEIGSEGGSLARSIYMLMALDLSMARSAEKIINTEEEKKGIVKTILDRIWKPKPRMRCGTPFFYDENEEESKE